MIVKRQKCFIGLDDGFAGLKGLIYRVGKKSDAYKKFGPWEVVMTDNAIDEYNELDKTNRDIVDNILKELETKPFQGNYGQHPLWEWGVKQQDCVLWSAEVNDKDRVTYAIYKFQNQIRVTNVIGHMIVDREYALRPELNKVKKN